MVWNVVVVRFQVDVVCWGHELRFLMVEVVVVMALVVV